MSKKYNFDSDFKLSEQSVIAVKHYYHNKFKSEYPTYISSSKIVGVQNQKIYGDLCFTFEDKKIHIEVKTDRRLDKTSSNVMVEVWAHLPVDPLSHNYRKGWFQEYDKVDAIVFHPEYHSRAYLFPYKAFKQYIEQNKHKFERFVLDTNPKQRSAGYKVDVNELMNGVKNAREIVLNEEE